MFNGIVLKKQMFGDSMPSLKQLIKTALIPVGKTLYVWGGGWNQDDSGAGESSLSLGARCTWEIFFNLYGKEYDFEKTRLMRNMGLDCSGYIGWVLYNVFYGEQKRNGFVFKAKDTAFKLHERRDNRFYGWRHNERKKSCLHGFGKLFGRERCYTSLFSAGCADKRNLYS